MRADVEVDIFRYLMEPHVKFSLLFYPYTNLIQWNQLSHFSYIPQTYNLNPGIKMEGLQFTTAFHQLATQQCVESDVLRSVACNCIQYNFIRYSRTEYISIFRNILQNNDIKAQDTADINNKAIPIMCNMLSIGISIDVYIR